MKKLGSNPQSIFGDTMGGRGSGRKKGPDKPIGDFSKQLVGEAKLASLGTFKKFAYIQDGVKYYGLKDQTSNITYKRMDENTFNYILQRLGTEDINKVLNRMYIYTNEGLMQRSETARGNIVSALNAVYNISDRVIVDGKEYSPFEIAKKLNSKTNANKWLRLSQTHSELIGQFFDKYRSFMARPPDESAGLSPLNREHPDNINSEVDQSAVSRQEFDDLFKDIIRTFKL